MDYNEEMLKLYFKENNFSKKQIDYLLEKNPFDLNYYIWEKQTNNGNRIYANHLKNIGILRKNLYIQEISNHIDNNVGKYLTNEVLHTVCSINDNINNVPLYRYNGLLLFKGFYKNEIKFLKKLENISFPYVTGICTSNQNYYEFVLNNYKNFLTELNKSELIMDADSDQLILTLKSK